MEHTGTDTVLHIDRGASAADACPATPQSGEDTPLSAFEAAGGGGGGGILSGCAVCGVLGVIELLTGRYLLVVADAEAVAEVGEHHIMRVTRVDIVPFRAHPATASSGSPLQQDEETYLAMLRSFVKSKHMYFSYTMDITTSCQRQSEWSPDKLAQPRGGTADPRFFWNEALARPFLRHGHANFVLPVMLGYVGFAACDVRGKAFSYCVISRKSKLRAGTRFNTRGLNCDGDAANFVETEQLVWDGEQLCSYVQTRGSVPVLWAQHVDLRISPRIVFNCDEPARDGAAAASASASAASASATAASSGAPGCASASAASQVRLAFRAHFREQQDLYGTQSCVSVLDGHGPEAELTKAFKNQLDLFNSELNLAPDAPQRLTLVDFDFHRLCSRMRYENLQVLLDRVIDRLNEQQFFVQAWRGAGAGAGGAGGGGGLLSGAVSRRQEGVFRVNCKDSLDRTNVVQTLFAEKVLGKMLRYMGVLGDTEGIGASHAFCVQFKRVWADQADALAHMYSGTPALKTDFTRTGRRTVQGSLRDLAYTLLRYYINNFCDGFRQDAYDLFLCNASIALHSAPGHSRGVDQQGTSRPSSLRARDAYRTPWVGHAPLCPWRQRPVRSAALGCLPLSSPPLPRLS